MNGSIKYNDTDVGSHPPFGALAWEPTTGALDRSDYKLSVVLGIPDD
ncbi:MAG: hypothetical protein ICV63_10515 [Coleofasciculus sp. Co-bin14]|nr:hypothetical protein [Coleofasciculus sp. Co-bin14]